ncbi:MAG: DUF433 domain-containing protein [Gemmataceae bacterium]|nr:DUF433 domain-containing protein [Gemmataceae bacterium]
MNTVEIEPLIRKTPDVIGGEACIRRSRVAVFMLVESKRLGRTDAELLDHFPYLTRQDLDAAWAYYAAHPDEIEDAIRRHTESG